MISIIIPVYNCENTIERCIKSLCKQKFDDIEILVIDDGSNDNSGNIVKQLLNSDNRIKYIKKENGGVSSARNLGIEISNGKYIMFIDGDDWVDKDYVESFYKILQKGNVDYIFSDWIVVNKNKSEEASLLKYGFKELDKISNLIKFYFTHRVGCAPWAKVYKKEILMKNGIRFNEKLSIAEDYIFNIEYLMCAESIEYNKSAHIYYVINNNGANYKIRKNYIELQECILKQLMRINFQSGKIYQNEIDFVEIFTYIDIVKYLRYIRKDIKNWRKTVDIYAKRVRRKKINQFDKFSLKDKVIYILMKLHCEFIIKTIIFIWSF